MSDPRALTIRDRVIAALNQTGAPANVPEATSRRAFPGDRIDSAILAVFLGAEPAEYPGNNRAAVMRRTRTVFVQIGVAVEDPADVDDETEKIRAWVVQQLGDTNLEGLVLSLDDRGIPEAPIVWKADAVYGLTHVAFAAQYQTSRKDLGSAA